MSNLGKNLRWGTLDWDDEHLNIRQRIFKGVRARLLAQLRGGDHRDEPPGREWADSIGDIFWDELQAGEAIQYIADQLRDFTGRAKDPAEAKRLIDEVEKALVPWSMFLDE